MIGYTTIGVSDMEKAKAFYSALFAEQGAKVLIDTGRIAFIGTKRGEPMLAVCEPYDKQDPTPGNGVMIAFPASTKAEAEALTTVRSLLERPVMANQVSVPGPFLWVLRP